MIFRVPIRSFGHSVLVGAANLIYLASEAMDDVGDDIEVIGIDNDGIHSGSKSPLRANIETLAQSLAQEGFQFIVGCKAAFRRSQVDTDGKTPFGKRLGGDGSARHENI